MSEFIYRAKKSPKEVVEGMVTAESRLAAIQKLAQKGLYPVLVAERPKGSLAKSPAAMFSGRKINARELANFTRQLSDLLSSGITIARSLDILSQQAQGRALKNIISEIRDSCVDGNSLSEALSRFPSVFSKLYTSLIKSGEASGSLDEVLMRLADFSEKQLETRAKVRSAMAYPILMSAVGVVTIWVLLAFVIPKITGMFSDLGQDLPAPTALLIQLSSFIRHGWWLAVLLLIFSAGILKKLYRKKESRRLLDRMILKIPVAGDLIKKVEIARFARTLATLIKNGVPALEALGVVADTIRSETIKSDVLDASLKVREGFGLARSFRKDSILPVLVINMIEIGEESGRLDEVLFKIAENYDRETDAAMKIMMSLLEPVLILVLGLVVGFIVVSMLLPIFEINFMGR